MLLKSLHPTLDLCNEHLGDFLSHDRNTVGKLDPCQATDFHVLRYVGSGKDGYVLECYSPQIRASVALKLFFQGRRPLHEIELWPLENEAEYYASCATRKAQYSEPSVPPPHLPKLPHTKWAKVSDHKLFETIIYDLSHSSPEPSTRGEILPILDKMCAYGWVAFPVNLRQRLWKTKSSKDQLVGGFTGDAIIGIVKPFFEKESSSGENLRTQIQMMVLMRHFGWELRDIQDRNWINGCLVDGGDVKVRPRSRHLGRSWATAFFQLMKLVKTQACDEDDQQGII